MTDPRQRFASRVMDYARYRPGYPQALYVLMASELGLGPGTRVADTGAGTGLFSSGLLDSGALVVAIEPNVPMARAARAALGTQPRFHCLIASAEATSLADACVDLVTAAQAFHWFDLAATRREWLRILRPGGQALVVWNLRRLDSTPFLRDYEALLREYGTDYASVAERYADEDVLGAFYAPGTLRRARFDHGQVFDRDGLFGRVASSSYVPQAGEPGHAEMMQALERIFLRHAMNGTVAFEYDTVAYWGRPSSA